MKVRRFVGKDMRHALTEITKELGPDAAILSNKRLPDGVEIIAAIGYDEAILAQRNSSSAPVESKVEKPIEESIDPPVIPKQHEHLSNELKGAALKTEPENLSSPKSFVDLQVESLDAPLDFSKKQPAYDNLWQQKIEWTDPSVSEIRSELANLKKTMESQFKVLSEHKDAIDNPNRNEILTRFQDMGVVRPVAKKLVDKLHFEGDLENDWQNVLQDFADSLQTQENLELLQEGIYAFVGPTGVGKTTTIAKLAARYALEFGPESLALISSDNYRIASHEQFRIYGNIIGCETHLLRPDESLTEVLESFQGKRLILIDTAGVSQADQRLVQQIQSIKSTTFPINNYLVLSATNQFQVLNQCMKLFNNIDLAGVVLTKLDEATSLGEVLSFVIAHQLGIAFITDGQQIPDDLRLADAEYLVAQAKTLYEKYTIELDESMQKKEANGFTGNLC